MNEEYSLSCLNVGHRGDDVCFVNERWNAIFSMDKKNFKVKYEDFPRKYFGNGRCYTRVAVWKDKLLLIPMMYPIPLYFIENGEHRLVSLPKSIKSTVLGFRSMIQILHHVYLFVKDSSLICLDIDMKTESISLVDGWEKVCSSRRGESYDVGMLAFSSGYIWSIVRGTSYIVAMDILSLSVKLYDMGENVTFDYCIQVKNGYGYAFANNSSCIVSFLIANPYRWKEINLKRYIGNRKYESFIIDDNVVYLFPFGGQDLIMIDLLSNNVITIDYPAGFSWLEDERFKRGNRFYCIEEMNNEIYLYPRTGNGIIVIDKANNRTRLYKMEADIENIKRRQAKEVDVCRVDGTIDDISFFVEMLIHNRLKKSSVTGDYITCGSQIYNTIK